MLLLLSEVTGEVGRAILAELANQPVRVRALLPTGAELPIQAPNIEVARCDGTGDERMLHQAVEGVEAAFIASAVSPQMAESHLRFVAAAKAAGVQRIVQSSVVGADPKMCCARVLRWFGQAETTAESSSIGITRLRSTNLLQHLLEFAPSIAQQGLIAGPFRTTLWNWVDARDVGAVAATILRSSAHIGQTYTVTGAESMNYPQIAERIGRVLEKPVRYADITANEARGWLQRKGLSAVMIEAKLELWDACASNLINVPATSVVKDITGREPRTLEQFVRDYRHRFVAASVA